MKPSNDRIRAKQLLEAREHGFALLPFMRRNAGRYALCSLPFAALLIWFAMIGYWFAFGCLVSFLFGLLFVYVRWFRGQRSVWPFAMKIINWDIVRKLSEDEPPA
jgi:hypothetical protein